MAQAGYTPIQLYYSTTASAAPSSGNLANGELAINITDGKLYYKDNGGTVRVLAGTGGTGVVAGSNTQVQYNNNGVFGASSGLTFDGTTLTANALTVTNATTLSAGTANGIAYLNGSKVLTTGTGLQFDGSNLGLGVTPSAWQTGRVALQIQRASAGGGVSIHTAATSQAVFAANTYFNGTNDIYTSSGAASSYVQFNGAHQWYTAPSGTAGNAISFTQAMTLDASGNLIVGDTAQVGSSKISMTINPATANVLAAKTSTNGDVAAFRLLSSDGNEQGAINVNTSGQNMTFRVANTERARIDSSGNLLVGVTSSIGSASNTSTGAQIAKAFTWIATTDSVYIQRPDGSNGSVMQFFKNAGALGSISLSGSSTAYNTSSDYRLKENIQPMTGALAKVAALKPCTYKWKADGSDGEGFIAHELAEVVPQCVTGEKDAVDAEGKPVYQGIDTSFLVATLTAAIQELKAEFDAYKASHP